MCKRTCSFVLPPFLRFPFIAPLLHLTCHFVPLSFTFALCLALRRKLSLNEFQIVFKCSRRHFQLFSHSHPAWWTIINTRTNRCRLLCLAVDQKLLALTLLYHHYPAMNNLSVVSVYSTEPRRWSETDWHVSSCNTRLHGRFPQECLRACASMSGNTNQEVCVNAIKVQSEWEKFREKSRSEVKVNSFLLKQY